MKKFLRVYLRCEGVVEKDVWTTEYLLPIQQFVDRYDNEDINIYDVGLDDNNTLIFHVDIVSNTKSECNAMLTLFKRDLKEVLSSYGLTKIVETLKAYGDKL